MEKAIAHLKELAAEAGFIVDEKKAALFRRYAELLREWNEKMNLTAITEPDEIAVKHFYDSMLLLTVYDIPEGAAVIDVGTGAGFPGVVLKIMRPDIKLTLLDSLNKRLVFLGEVLKELGLEATCLHARAEEAARGNLRESFDLATARAVAALPVLSEYCLPFVKVGGAFVAMKGPSANEEASAAERAISLLGGKQEGVKEHHLPGGDVRLFVTVRKISQTPTKYPRPSGKIAKSSL